MKDRPKFTWKFHFSPFIILSLFILTYFIYKDFNIRMVYGYVLLFSFLVPVILFAMKNNNRKIFNFSSFEKLYFLLVITVFLNTLRWDTHIDYELGTYIFAMLISYFYVCFGKIKISEINFTFKMIFVGVSLFSTWELLNLYFPSFKYIFLPYLSLYAQEYNLYVLSKGFFITIGSDLTYTCYVLVLGVAVLVSNKNNSVKQKIGVLIFLFTIIIIGRRGELLAIILSILFFIVLKKNKTQRVIMLLLAVLGIILVIPTFEFLFPYLKEYHIFYRYILTFQRAQAGADISSGRFELYRIATNLFLKNPILGIGWGNFVNNIPIDFLLKHGMNVTNVHNIYLQFFCETGIIGASIIIGVLGGVYIKTIKLLKFIINENSDEKSGVQSLCYRCIVTSFIIQTFFLVVGMLDPIFYKLIFWFFYALAIRLISVANRLIKLDYMEDCTGSELDKDNFD